MGAPWPGISLEVRCAALIEGAHLWTQATHTQGAAQAAADARWKAWRARWGPRMAEAAQALQANAWVRARDFVA
jgi:hypothetical protein